jgi:hypothetical protein
MANNPAQSTVIGGNDANQFQAWMIAQFQGTTYQANALDVQHEPLYDVSWNPATTAPWAAGATIPVNTQFFQTGNSTGKTLADTNVVRANQLQAPVAFAVMGIGLRWAENALLADIITFENQMALEFWIGQKSYNRAPPYFYNNGGGATGFSNASGASAVTNGRTGKMDRHELAINIVIDNQASFYGQLVGTATVLAASGAGGTGLNLKMILDGLHARGVQ